MNLSQLAPDALQIVCEHLDGLDIGLLWLTGDRLQNCKLGTSCVTRFVHTYESYRPIVWPKVIASFQRLNTLSLSDLQALHSPRPCRFV